MNLNFLFGPYKVLKGNPQSEWGSDKRRTSIKKKKKQKTQNDEPDFKKKN